MASTGHPSFDSRQRFSSSGVVGCLLTKEYALSSLRPKLFGAVSLQSAQSIHSAQSTKYFPRAFSGALFLMSAIRRFLTTRCCQSALSLWISSLAFIILVLLHWLRPAQCRWQSLIRWASPIFPPAKLQKSRACLLSEVLGRASSCIAKCVAR